MAKTVYSTHYIRPDGNVFWAGRISGLFQVKEDLPAVGTFWEGLGSTMQSPSISYEWNDFDIGTVDVIDYDVARHWPHP